MMNKRRRNTRSEQNVVSDKKPSVKKDDVQRNTKRPVLKTDDFEKWFYKTLLQSLFFFLIFYAFVISIVNPIERFFYVLLVIMIADVLAFYLSSTYVRGKYVRKGKYTRTVFGRVNLKPPNVILYIVYLLLRAVMFVFGIVMFISAGFGNTIITYILSWFVCTIVAKSIAIVISNVFVF